MDTLCAVAVVGNGGVAIRDVVVIGDAVSAEVVVKVANVVVVDIVALLSRW